jgi:hypothetical protein
MWKFIKRLRRQPTVILGGERIAVSPLGLEKALELLLLLAPYLALLERHLPVIQAALWNIDGKRPDLLSAVFRALAGEMQSAPGDLTRAVALLVDRDPEWVAVNALADEVVQALPVLDRVNDFGTLLQAMDDLGLKIEYVRETNGARG